MHGDLAIKTDATNLESASHSPRAPLPTADPHVCNTHHALTPVDLEPGCGYELSIYPLMLMSLRTQVGSPQKLTSADSVL